MLSRVLTCSVVVASALLLSGIATSRAQIVVAPSVTASGPAADSDSERESRLRHEVERALIAEKFDDLDRLADDFRRNKGRLPGGGLKLHVLYDALNSPHKTDEDTVEHLAHLQNWMQLRPESITARIALAASLHRWAWVARGGNYADKVPAADMQLFLDRHRQAQVVLEGSRDLHTMCPQWYVEMMNVAQADGWGSARMRELFDRAVQFEPSYQYIYKQYAELLLPKWYGQPGESAKFVTDSANKLMGSEGDILYYQMASELIRRGDGSFNIKELDWVRIQRGYHAVVAAYGTTRGMDNKFLYIACRYKDASVARPMFASIGDRYEHSVWGGKDKYDKARDWAAGDRSWP